MSVGKISEFLAATGNWSLYVERLEMFFKVNKIAQDMRLPTLIAVIGEETYELLSNLVSPKKPADMTYEQVTEALRKHLQPKRSVMAERYHFRQRRQAVDEGITQYIAELKRMAKYCDFGSSLEDNLRDQLVCGLRSDIIRQRLFAEDDLKYERAVKLACALEGAERDAAAVEQTGERGASAGAVHALQARARVASTPRARSQRGSAAPTRRPAGAAPCQVCGATDHVNTACKFKNFVCHLCGNRGHLRRVCPERSGGAAEGRGHFRVYSVHTSATAASAQGDRAEDTEPESDLHQLCLNNYKPVSIEVWIDNIPTTMELDTGSAVSCISKHTYLEHFKHRPMYSSDVVFKFYDGTKIKPLGVIKPIVKYQNKEKALELFVVDGGSTSLLGRHWWAELEISIPAYQSNQNSLFSSQVECGDLSILIDRYKDLFNGGLGRFTGGKASLRVREDAVPVYCRARPLPYAIRDQIDQQLDDMLREGIIEPVDTSEWATPLVPVRKPDGSLRICADYKVTLNPALLVDRFPLPRINDLLVGLNGAQFFSKIDLSQAYNQIELDESKEYTVINTHRGLFKYNRLVFGLSSSPGIFQRIMSNLLHDIPNVEFFLDDIIIATRTVKEHLDTLERVFNRFHSHGMKFKKEKCLFMVDQVKYLGYIISKDGLKVDQGKVEAITNIPRPSNVNEVRSFLGIVNFYAKFVKSISTVLAPLYNLLKKNVSWKWCSDCEQSFRRIKEILTSADVLVHYDPGKQLILTCDASSRGVGGVLTQPGVGGIERPVAYVSRSLTDAEKNYSQIDKEALAIIFCLQKLHQYLYGRRFTLRTDHKPLVSIFGPKHGIPTMAASRLQRWAIKLSAYTYDIEYVNTKENGADGLSRLPLARPSSGCEGVRGAPEQTYLHFAQDALALDYNTVKNSTLRDPTLSRILGYLRDEWPQTNEFKNLQPYFNRKAELYEELGCIMWGHRVVIPDACRDKVLKELHECHMGIVKTKALARSYVWWPGVDEAIEGLCRACAVCAAEADAPPKQTPSLWPWPNKAWSRVHMDYLGPIFGKLYLVMVDAGSKWLEVFEVPSTSAQHAIARLSETFARWGIPKQIVSDNGPPFTSADVASFFRNQGVEHVFSAPYHPASNGAAENAVRTVKRVIRKAVREKNNVNLALNTFLLYYRNTEHCTTGVSPASLMLGRHVRTKLDAMRPDCESKVRKAQERQERNCGGTPGRAYEPGEPVWVRQYQGGTKWVPGEVTQQLGSRDYRILDEQGKSAHRHSDQLRRRTRNSLVCPDSPVQQGSGPPLDVVRSATDTSSETGGSGVPATVTISAPVVPDGNLNGESGRDSGDIPEALAPCASALSSPRASPPQPRPVRQCRLENPPSYKT